MKLKDARHLTAKAQEALRYRVVNAVKSGMSKSEASRVFQVSRTAVHNWTFIRRCQWSIIVESEKAWSRVLVHVCSHTKQLQQYD